MKSDVSSIYDCIVMHHRLTPVEHRFQYRVFYLWLDLDAIDGLAKRLWCFSRNRFNLFSFHDHDHLNLGESTTKANILRWLTEQGFDAAPVARIMLLTFPRVLGYIFNPVSFYYCFDADGAPVCAVAQVTNTFHEQKAFLLKERDERGRFRLLTEKHFYVSPFVPLDFSFDFKLELPSDKLDIHIDDHSREARTLLTALTGKRRQLTAASLFWCAIKYPLLTLRVIFLIHWNALRLWLKRIPWHRKAADAALQKDVLRPHHSIAPTKP
ncbi:MAG: DUF1365 domain-containing protein [Verrucomicrobiaceae bacterium]